VDNDQLSAAAGQIRSYGAVTVLGAGLSAARFPMTTQLRSLLWHAIDAVPAARDGLAATLGIAGTAKEMIGQDSDAVDSAWRLVERDPAVRTAFQRAFARLDADREPSAAHYALARLVHAGLVEYVVSFNWDTALERASEQLFGTSLTGRRDLLAKPHGDAAQPDVPWVLPHQEGVVPQDVIDHVAELSAERPRALLVVGYSGSDEVVVSQLLTPAAGRWPVIRVGPSATGDEAVTGTADDVVPALADALDAPIELPGWRWVTFTRFRDLSAALLGYRLGPQDVNACPELPVAKLVADRLRQARFAAMVGDSGSGKSITAFQVARRLNKEGWAVVELAQPGIASSGTIRTFEAVRGPVLAVVDDAQALSPDVVAQFERAASGDHAVLVVSTERPAGQERVTVSATRAVAALERHCLNREEEVTRLVAEIDDRVGHGAMREPLRRRLESAKSADYPWQFMYVLSGGERRIGAALDSLAADGDSALLFGILAAAQLLSLDAGASLDYLLRHARALGRDERWLRDGLATLVEHRLVVDRQARLRTPHLRIADRGLLVLCRTPQQPQSRELVTFLRSRLLDPAESLQGKLWALRAVDQSDPLRYGRPQMLLDEQTAEFLADACLVASPGRERSIAAYLLWEIGWWRALSTTLAERVAAALPGWILAVTSDDVFGLRWVLSGLRSQYPELHGAVSAQVAPEDVAERLADHGTPETGEDWGHLLTELAHAHGADSDTWGSRFQDMIDTDRLVAWVASAPPGASIRGNAELVHHLAWLAPRAAAAALTAITPTLSRRLEQDVAVASQDITPWAFSLFPVLNTQDEAFWQANRAHAALRQSVLDLVRSTDWAAAGGSLARAALHETAQLDLLTFSLASFAPDALAAMLAAISLDHLDQISEGHWRDLAGIQHLVVSLAAGVDREPARSWVERHRYEIERLPTLVVPIAPRVAVELIERGGHVDLDPQDGLRWGWCAEALAALLREHRDAASAAVAASSAAITAGLTLRQANMTEDLAEFVTALDELDPGMLVRLLEAADVETARQHWPERLAGSAEEAAAADLLIRRALLTRGAVAELAQAVSTIKRTSDK